MATVNVYLTFNGNTEEAFNFYKSVFGGEFDYIGKFKDMPPSEDYPSPSPEEAVITSYSIHYTKLYDICHRHNNFSAIW